MSKSVSIIAIVLSVISAGCSKIEEKSGTAGVVWKYNIINGNVRITGCELKKAESKYQKLVVPQQIDGFLVAQIDSYTFKVRPSRRSPPLFRNIETLKLPDGLTGVEDYTFFEFPSLKTVKLPNSITNIGNYAFSSNAEYVRSKNGVECFRNTKFCS